MTFKKPSFVIVLIFLSVFVLTLKVVNVATFKAPVSTPAQAVEEGHDKKDAAKKEESVAGEKTDAPPSKEETVKATAAKEKAAIENAAREFGASVTEEHAAAGNHAAAPEKADAAETPPPMPGEDRVFSTSEVEVLQSLAKRRDELDVCEKTVAEREALLKAAGTEVDRKVTELNKLKGEMEALLDQQKTAEEGRVTSFVKIYENMKPKDAARIFDTLEMDILLDVIGRMSEKKSSPILASMNPDRAREVTIQLAEQRRLPKPGEKPGEDKKDSAKGAAPSAVPPALPGH